MSTLPTYSGPIEGVLRGDVTELLHELIAVVDATRDKSIKLTKSGIPPKPLWSAVNDRIIWQDPKAILYDWDEVDQVRLIYCVAVNLALVQPDEERLLVVGPGADQFYLSAPTRRAEMLLRAYIDLDDWDERCDARNNQGHRQNFGQTFRRDFKVAIQDLRQELLAGLRLTPSEGWVYAEELAIAVTRANPDLLVCEDDEPLAAPDEGSDPEIARLVDYWLFLVARLGLVDLARGADGSERDGERVYRLTPLGSRLLGSGTWSTDGVESAAVREQRPFIVQPNNDIVFYRPDGDAGDEYLLHRIAEDAGVPNWEEPVVTYRVTRHSLAAAVEGGLDPQIIRDRLVHRAKAQVPTTFLQLIADAERSLGSAVVIPGYTAVELEDGSDALAASLDLLGFEVYGRFVMVPWRRWGEFVALAGGEPEQAFRYPSDEPLIAFDGDTAELQYLATPLAARDLLDSIGLDGNARVLIDEALLARLAFGGWSPRAVAEALEPLVETLPKRLRAELR